MGSILFMKPVLNTVSQGKLFSRVVAIILRIVAIIAIIKGVVSWIGIWTLVFHLSALGVIGGIIFQLIYVIAIYMVVHVILIRAAQISNLPAADYTVIPIIAIFLKLVGEVFACFVVPVAVGACIFIWLAGYGVFDMICPISECVPYLGSGGIFLCGLFVMIFGVVISFLVLMYCYFLSEFTIVFVDIAGSTKATRQIAEQYDKSEGAPPSTG
jgi:hypothetical protein